MSKTNTDFEGLILFRRDYREHDLLVKFLTRDLGPVMFFVRGGRRKGSKLAPSLLPFTFGTYAGWVEGGELSYLSTAKEVTHLRHIGEDLDANAYATYLLELVDAAFEEGVGIGAWYDQILAALLLIDSGKDPQVIVNVLEVQLLGRFGVAPNWQACSICGRTDRPMDYSEAYGGLLCAEHWDQDPHRLHLATTVVNYLRLFSQFNLRQVGEVDVPKRDRRDLRWALDKIYGDQVGLRLRSKHFIDSLGDWEDQLSWGPTDQKSEDSPQTN